MTRTDILYVYNLLKCCPEQFIQLTNIRVLYDKTKMEVAILHLWWIKTLSVWKSVAFLPIDVQCSLPWLAEIGQQASFLSAQLGFWPSSSSSLILHTIQWGDWLGWERGERENTGHLHSWWHDQSPLVSWHLKFRYFNPRISFDIFNHK